MSIDISNLNGETGLVGLLGDPIRQVRAPKVLTEHFQSRGLNLIHIAFHVTAAGLDDFMRAAKATSNIVGFGLTVPHKVAGVRHADVLSDLATGAGAVNVLRREAGGVWRGHQLDGAGFVGGLRASGGEPRGRSVFVSGAGGAGSGIVSALADAGAASIRIYDVDRVRAGALIQRVGARWPSVNLSLADSADPTGCEIVVNATPLGMRPDDPLPMETDRLTPDMHVADVVMKPTATPFIAAALRRGCLTSVGENMMHHQMNLLVDFFADAVQG